MLVSPLRRPKTALFVNCNLPLLPPPHTHYRYPVYARILGQAPSLPRCPTMGSSRRSLSHMAASCRLVWEEDLWGAGNT